jgi:hypothetical protein
MVLQFVGDYAHIILSQRLDKRGPRMLQFSFNHRTCFISPVPLSTTAIYVLAVKFEKPCLKHNRYFRKLTIVTEEKSKTIKRNVKS